MFKDLPEGQTHCYTPEEEMRMGFELNRTAFTTNSDWHYSFERNGVGCYCNPDLECQWVGWQAALSSQAEQIRKLEEETANADADNRSLAFNSEGMIARLRGELTQATTTIAALQAEIKARSDDGADAETFERMKELRAQVAATSERELALLAVIEQMREKGLTFLAEGQQYGEQWRKAELDFRKALALTPEAALNEFKARVLEDLANEFFASGIRGDVWDDLRCMASELRQP